MLERHRFAGRRRAGARRLRLRLAAARSTVVRFLARAFGRFSPPVAIRRGLRSLTRRVWAWFELSQRWRWHGSWLQRPLRLGLWVLVLFTVCVAVASVVSVSKGKPWGPGLGTTVKHCDDTGFACNVVSNIVFTFVPLALAFALFLFRRLTRIRRTYVAQAQTRPTELVETAGSIVGKVVGRRDICDVIQDDIRDRDGRRPHVIVGGVGTGKTAVLVELTRLLARRGAVPVPVRLRDATSEVDFVALARERFLRVTGKRLLSEAEGERVWRQLRKEDRVVVLADGLEEALADDGDGQVDRHHRVRVAVSEAGADGFPLVIASRPHDALNALDAALVHLEPLSVEAGREYIEEAHPGLNDPRLDWIVTKADVAEAPLYLQVTRQLHAGGLLDPEHLETRGVDRVELRRRLMETWIKALVEGKLLETDRVALNHHQREAMVWYIAGLACVALTEDTLQVRFDQYLDPSHRPIAAAAAARASAALKGTQMVTDVQIAASDGARLGLVEHLQNGVRFPHSIMQAYLASRLVGDALRDSRYLERGLARASRELLVALVMYSRSREANEPFDGEGSNDRWTDHTWRTWLRDRLRDAASQASGDGEVTRLTEAKRLDVLAAAIEIDSVTGTEVDRERPDLARLGHELVRIWQDATIEDDSTQDAKFKAVEGLGESARRLGARAKLASDAPADEPTERATPDLPKEPIDPPPPASFLVIEARSAYQSLYTICCAESHYRVRLAAAQELGDGGDAAFAALKDVPGALRSEVGEREGGIGLGAEGSAGSRAWSTVLRDGLDVERQLTLRGWLLPMLVHSVGEGTSSVDVRRALDDWLARVGTDSGDGDAMMPLSLEAALAQGFKHAANRRPVHPSHNADTRAVLVTRATKMLKNARFWYSRLTLLHALCLWKLSSPGDSADEAPDFGREVEHWLRHRTEGEHPFVLEAADLVVNALHTGQPERYIWIDESGVVTKVGSRATRPLSQRQPLWIPPSTGWIRLERRAQQLVADILVLLNLAERGATVEGGGSGERMVAYDREQRLDRVNSNELPPCITEERCERLRPSRTVGTAQMTAPGDSCREGCPVDLCPYPARGQQPYRVELSEAFCRHQRAILRLRDRLGSPAPWQDASRKALMRFWTEMEQRARL